MEITARTKIVRSRNNLGRFASRMDEAAERVINRTVSEGAQLSRDFAPVGNKIGYTKKPGYIPLKQSIRTETQGTTGSWYSIAPHGGYVEFGTPAHLITGKLKFFWKGGYFYWNNPQYGPVGSGKPYENWTQGRGAWVRHPGTRAQPYLGPAYETMKRRMMQIVREEY